MKSMKNIGRTTGILLLLIVAFGVLSMNLWGLTPSLPDSSDFLNQIVENGLQLRISMVLDMVVAGLWLGIGIYLYPFIESYKQSLALGFLGIWIVYFAIVVFGLITELSLLSLGSELVNTPNADMRRLNALGLLKVREYFWAHFFGIILFSISSLLLYYTFLQKKCIPIWLSIWGLLALSVVFVSCWLVVFGIKVDFVAFGQNGIFMLALIVWLLVKGFREMEKSPKNKI